MVSILVVDDSDFTRDMLVRMLREAGYDEVTDSPSDTEAVKIVKKEKPNVVLLDVSFEAGDGIKALMTIKKSVPDTKVIMITAVADQVINNKEIADAADGYVIKPFKKDHLLRAIDFVIQEL